MSDRAPAADVEEIVAEIVAAPAARIVHRKHAAIAAIGEHVTDAKALIEQAEAATGIDLRGPAKRAASALLEGWIASLHPGARKVVQAALGTAKAEPPKPRRRRRRRRRAPR